MKSKSHFQIYMVNFYFFILAIALSVPLRWALQTHVYEYQSIFDFFYTGLFLDLKYFFLVFAVSNVLFFVLSKIIKNKKVFNFTFISLFILFFILGSLMNLASAQFFIERGVFASGFDIMNSTGDSEFFTSYLKIILSPKFLMPLVLVSIPLFLVCLWYFVKVDKQKLMSLKPTVINFCTCVLASVFFWNVFIKTPDFFPLILDRDRVTSPLAILNISSFSPKNRSVSIWLESFNSNSIESDKGMQFLGLKNWHEPLDNLFKNQKNKEIQAVALDVANNNNNQPPIIWHILVEGFRAHELKINSPLAPVEVAPFFNSLYSSNELGGTHQVISFKNVHQAGIRTSQGLSATFCGLGTMPYSLSITRDFGKAKLSCLPKIFNDLGFQTRFFNAVSPSFDKKNVFLSDQGTVFISNNEVREQVKWDGWGIPDRIFYDYILDNHAAQPTLAEYNAILTISNHGPFNRPPDVDNHLQKKYEEILKTANKDLTDNDRSRILTYMYSDQGVSEFVNRILKSPEGARSIFVIQADHASSGGAVWGSSQNPEIYTKIPFVFVYPKNFNNSNQLQFENKIKNLENTYLSQNDLPRLLLYFLSEVPEIKNKNLKEINHSLGGQVLTQSPPIVDDAIIWGVNIRSRYYYIKKNKEMVETNHYFERAPDFSKEPIPVVSGDRELLSALRTYFVKDSNDPETSQPSL